jgi:hypothetical protein
MCLATATKDHAQGASKHTDPGGVLKLLAKLAAKARAKFPDNAFFQCLVGEMEIRKGPRKCRRRFARGCFQRAVDLTQGANDPDSIVIAKRAKEKILFLDECGLGGPDRYRRSAAGLPPMPMPDDIPSELADLIKELDDGGDGPSPGKAAGALFEMFARACRDAGINPERILDEMAGDMPFRFRPKGFPNATRKKGE